LAEPLLSGRVFGQDSTQAIVWNGRVRWFWGDTGRPDYPLGNFAASGATSFLPEDGGLSPDVGVNLDYFTDDSGFSRGMVASDRDGLKWLDGLIIVADESGTERLLARCALVKELGVDLGTLLVAYDAEQDAFVE